MKRLQSTYTSEKVTVIIPNGRAPFRRRFDPWHSHSTGDAEFGYTAGVSGKRYLSTYFQLADGNYYFYVQSAPIDPTAAETFYEAAANFRLNGYYKNSPGEGFNALYRPLTWEKYPISQADDWRNSH